MLVKGIFTQISGAMGGIVGSHNRFGMYIRARTIPVNPNTSYQQAVRSLMSLLSTRWQDTLTQVQRDAWDVFGTNMPVINRQGDTIYLTGLNHFVRGNLPRLQAGDPQVDNGPINFVMPSFTPPTIQLLATTDQVAVTFETTDDWANEDDASMLVFASRPVAATINYFKGPYRYAGRIQGDSATPPTSPSSIALPFPIEAGHKVFVRIVVTRADGRLSPDFRDSGVGV